MKLAQVANVSTLLLSLTSLQALAWGNRGHHAICEAATQLVKEPTLKHFLSGRGHVMGHLCNIPDISWRSLASKVTELGNPTHYLSAESVHIGYAQIPAKFEELRAKSPLALNAAHEDLGSLWWRADEFYRLATQSGKTATSAGSPSPGAEQNDSDAFNRSVYQMYTLMGLMGHYVGDASMPYHNTDDYDGWAKGHGGIHSYYEDLIVNEISADYTGKIFNRAKRLASSKGQMSVVERMRALGLTALADLPKVEALDKVIRPSKITTIENKQVKSRAERVTPEKMVKKFEPLIIDENARSAKLLAEFWDEIYVQAGKPDLNRYKSFRYPLDVEFVAPDYLGEK
ncbi:MAG: hypothetical protein JST16_04040 [Bdellovibrionales bacterium]|nr:hypothetical protein [Bdellovibrionales bacterium]